MKRFRLALVAVGLCSMAFTFGDPILTTNPWTADNAGQIEERIDTVEQFEHCETLIVPTGLTTDDDVASIWRARTSTTIDKLWCETDTGTATINLQRDDGSPADIRTSNITCVTSGVESTANLDATEKVLAAGHRIDLSVVSVTGPPLRLTVCFGGTR